MCRHKNFPFALCVFPKMPRHCSAAGCKSRDTSETRKAGITFHRLPKRGSPRRTLWIINSQRKDPQGKGQWDPQSHFIYFCSKHFTPESFELSGISGYRRLKEDALPTVFETLSRQRRGRGVTNKQTGATRQTRKPTRSQKCPKVVVEANDQQKEEAAANEGNVAGLQPSSPPQPPSPSRYMRRLPPPPGFHLPKEHNYAQLCPLVWRKRYDRAIDSLEKSLRLLNAARRRETRLRQTLLRLRENRVRQTLQNFRGATRWKETKVKGKNGLESEDKRDVEQPVRQVSDEQEMETEKMEEDLNLFDEEAGDSGEGGYRSAFMGMQEETGYCFYCGRGMEDLGGNEGGALGKSQRPRQSLEQGKNGSWCDDGVQNKRASTQGLTQTDQKAEIMAADAEGGACSYYYYSSNTTSEESDEGVQIVTMELPQGWQLPQQPKMGEQIIASPQVQKVQGQSHPEQQEDSDGRLLVVQVPKQDSEKHTEKNEKSEPLLVSVVGFQNELTEESQASYLEADSPGQRIMGQSDKDCGHPTDTKNGLGGGDLREKLKEHLEGFQLQLSNPLGWLLGTLTQELPESLQRLPRPITLPLLPAGVLQQRHGGISFCSNRPRIMMRSTYCEEKEDTYKGEGVNGEPVSTPKLHMLLQPSYKKKSLSVETEAYLDWFLKN
ncbi:hypothetical protein Z043_119088 [Scleropages formosus]|uniref:THAP-type domain-containing protein n=1 Tax=Scleropages formosus TaxID=113540 RepID=A0A0P7TYH5_SCLFO|nr:hypothetical protein Z043_119088 [Scleropages formosus]